MNKKNRLYKGRIDTNDAEWAMINRATLHELSLRIPSRNVTARMVYILLLTYADNKGVCWPSHKTLAQILNVNRDAILKAYDTLRNLDFIKTTKLKNKKSLKVQIYSVHHKLIFPEDQVSAGVEEDNFPETEEFFSTNDNLNPKKEENTCMSQHTDTCMFEHAPVCTSENTPDCMLLNTQIDHGTDHVNRPVEYTTPPIVNYNPPLEDPRPFKEKPIILLSSSEIDDYYEYGKKIPSLDNADDKFIREQIPEIQCMFILIRDWNIYWGFDASDINFTKDDVRKAKIILDYNSYDEAIEMIQNLAGEMDKPSKVVDLSYFKGFLLDGLYQDS